MFEPICCALSSDVLLALPDFHLLWTEIVGGDTELVVGVELPRDVQACPSCGSIERHEVHDRLWHRVRHLPVAGRACTIVWSKRLLDCAGGCGTFTERASSIAPRAVWTNPARRAAVAAVAANEPIERVRLRFGVAWNTVMRACHDAARRVPLPDGVRVGIDETVMIAGRTRRRPRGFVTAVVDLDTCLVLDVAYGRDHTVAATLLAASAPNATVITCDLFTGFRTAAAATGATVVADVFHVLRLAVAMLDQVRRRRQQDLHGHRGRKGDPLYDLRGLLRVATRRLDQATVDDVYARLRTADPDDHVGCAWATVELVHDLYRAHDRADAELRLDAIMDWAATVQIPELTRLAGTLARWRREVLAFFDTRATNGPTESANVKIKDIRRAARGFTSFANYRTRIILHAGQRPTIPTTSRLRGPYATAA